MQPLRSPFLLTCCLGFLAAASGLQAGIPAQSDSDPDPGAAAVATVRIAVTQSGVQVESTRDAAKGDLVIETPFGLFVTPTDPVQLVLHARARQDWRAVSQDPEGPSLVPWIEDFSGSGRLSELLELAAAVLERSREDELAALLPALDHWGAVLDPTPKGLGLEERVDWLWNKVLKTPGPVGLLLGAQLAEEVIEGGNAIGPRQLSITTLKRGLRNESPVVQRTAALVAGRQILDEPFVSMKILTLSLRGEPMVRRACARTVAGLWPEHAREYWTQALLRGEEEDRIQSVRHLADALPDRAVKPFAIVLSAVGRVAPARFHYGDKSVQVVKGTQDPQPVLSIGSSSGGASYSPSDAIEGVSVVKLTRVPPELAAAIGAALAALEGEGRERTPEQWAELLAERFD